MESCCGTLHSVGGWYCHLRLSYFFFKQKTIFCKNASWDASNFWQNFKRREECDEDFVFVWAIPFKWQVSRLYQLLRRVDVSSPLGGDSYEVLPFLPWNSLFYSLANLFKAGIWNPQFKGVTTKTLPAVVDTAPVWSWEVHFISGKGRKTRPSLVN